MTKEEKKQKLKEIILEHFTTTDKDGNKVIELKGLDLSGYKIHLPGLEFDEWDMSYSKGKVLNAEGVQAETINNSFQGAPKNKK